MKRKKILVCGFARHGKDSFAEIINEKINYSFTSSSQYICDVLYEPFFKGKFNYSSKEECFNDRINHRELWYEVICKYNSPDKSRLSKEIITENDIYVGMRDDEEFYASKDLFDLIVWVDASERLPSEGNNSNKITKEMCDIVITNNDSLEEFIKKIDNFIIENEL